MNGRRVSPDPRGYMNDNNTMKTAIEMQPASAAIENANTGKEF